MRRRGGRKMQAVRDKYGYKSEHVSSKYEDMKASERFDLRIKCAQNVTDDVVAMSEKMYKMMMEQIFKEIYGKK